ncbi:MAG: hypothetical protein VX589_04500 [Myxococcota bacterium]|nr:hypothetical protein [Myxococcota bacterium]
MSRDRRPDDAKGGEEEFADGAGPLQGTNHRTYEFMPNLDYFAQFGLFSLDRVGIPLIFEPLLEGASDIPLPLSVRP